MTEGEAVDSAGEDVVDRVLASAAAHSSGYTLFSSAEAQALQNRATVSDDVDQFDREDRQALRRVAGLSTELEDVTEVEYRQLRIERVVLIGIYAQGALEEAENSMRELFALAETAGAVVLDGLLQRRATPGPSTYFGKGKAVQHLAGLHVLLCGRHGIATKLLGAARRLIAQHRGEDADRGLQADDVERALAE